MNATQRNCGTYSSRGLRALLGSLCTCVGDANSFSMLTAQEVPGVGRNVVGHLRTCHLFLSPTWYAEDLGVALPDMHVCLQLCWGVVAYQGRWISRRDLPSSSCKPEADHTPSLSLRFKVMEAWVPHRNTP